MGVDTLSTAAKHPGILMSRWFRLWNNVLGPGKQRKLPVIVYRDFLQPGLLWVQEGLSGTKAPG